MSFRVAVNIQGEVPARNALRFATFDDADLYGYDLLCRWFEPESYDVEEIDVPATHRWDGHYAEPIEDDENI